MNAPLTLTQYVSQLQTIPSGRFIMGRTYMIEDDQRFTDEVPAHPVDISQFKMGATPVTVGMWREYVLSDKCLSMPDSPPWNWIDNHPMVNVSWDEIMGVDGKGGFCAWASAVAGLQLTLPTEAQFEYAAKGGHDDKYPWGNDYDTTKLWSESLDNTYLLGTGPVDRTNRIDRNIYGLTDMIGNVWQWCADIYCPYEASSEVNPTGPSSISDDFDFRCVRGGSWDYLGVPSYFRCALRSRCYPDFSRHDTGFRLSTVSK